MGKPAVMAIRIIGDATGAKKAFNGLEKFTHNFSKKFGKWGPLVSMGMTAAIAAAPAAAGATVKALYDIGEKFDEVEDTIRVGTGATGDALAGLVDDAKAVGKQVPVDFAKIGPVVADVNTRLGLSGETLQTVSSQYLEASRILGEDVDVMKTGAAFNAFNIEAEDTSTALDTLYRVSQDTGAGMNELADTMVKHSPALTGLGFSFDQSAALVGALDKAGLDANKTLSGMSRSLVTLAKDGEAPADAFQRVTGEIDSMIKSGDEAGALELSAKLFGTRGAPAFLKAIKDGTLNMADLSAAAEGSGDTILQAGKDTMDAAESWQILKNNALVALEPLGSKVFSALGDTLAWITDLVQGLDFSAFTSSLDSPAFTTAKATLTGIGRGFKAVWDAVQPLAIALLPSLAPVFEGLKTIVSGAFTAISGYISGALTIIQGVIRTFTALLNGDWAAAWEGVKTIASGAWKMVTSLISGAITVIKGIIQTGLAIIRTMWSNAWNMVKSVTSAAFSRIRSAVSSGINSAVSTVRTFPGRAVRAIGNLGGHLYGAGRDLIHGMIRGIGSMGRALWNAASNIAGNAIDAIKSKLGIRSPSRVFMALGKQTGLGFALGLEDQSRAAAAAANGIAHIPTAISGNRHTSTPVVNNYEIHVHGIVDKQGAAREIKDLLTRLDRANGRVHV